jgi:hypothetical protein
VTPKVVLINGSKKNGLIYQKLMQMAHIHLAEGPMQIKVGTQSVERLVAGKMSSKKKKASVARKRKTEKEGSDGSDRKPNYSK